MRLLNAILLLLLVVMSNAFSQDSRIRWKKSTKTTNVTLQLFHATKSINLPSAQMLNMGEFEYEISHRFLPLINDDNAFGGLDGPANMRMGLSYAPTNHLLFNIARSNLLDNIDFFGKYRVGHISNNTIPMVYDRHGPGEHNDPW